jgi:septal ring factor EnvC (AmiA/AmiB activator)
MQRFNFFLTSTLLSVLISGCVNQNPAPIEYASSNSPISNVPNYYGIPQNTKTPEETITTQDLIVNESVNNNDNKSTDGTLSYEEKIKNLDDRAEKTNYKKTIADDEIEKELSEIQKEDKKINNKVVNNKALSKESKKREENREKEASVISEVENDIKIDGDDEQNLESEERIKKGNTENKIGSSDFVKPVNGKVINKHEEFVGGKKIKGIYVASNDGVVKSSNSGEVLFSGYDNDFGNLVIVKSNVGNDEIMVAYANLSSLNVKKGEVVKRDGLIGNVEIGKKVHIAFRKNKQVVDPLEYLNY